MNELNKYYSFSVLEGTHYEIGKMQGNIIKNIPPVVKILTLSENITDDEKRDIDKANNLINKHCPNIIEEIEGFASALGISPESASYAINSVTKESKCSQFVVLPNITEDNHIYVGRSYEFSDNFSDLRLCYTNPKGKAKHFGFSEFQFGRQEGLNEYGLCVTMSATPILEKRGPEMMESGVYGLKYWAAIRTILENCKTVEEAIDYLKATLIGFNCNLIISDASSNACLVEMFGNNKYFMHIDKNNAYLLSTNHYQQNGALNHYNKALNNSIIRYNLIKDIIENKKGKINKDTIKELLSNKYPSGLSCSYYSEFFGTLWSIVFDVTEKSVTFCFGSPSEEKWQTVTFDKLIQPNVYPIKLIDEKANPDFWSPVIIKG